MFIEKETKKGANKFNIEEKEEQERSKIQPGKFSFINFSKDFNRSSMSIISLTSVVERKS